MSNLVWTIAGSDSSAGAGIQADLHTLRALGAEGCCVISAVTAQNSQTVSLVEPVSDQMFSEQIERLAEDMPAKVIKIGLLASVSQVKILAARLVEFKSDWSTSPYVIYDPVSVASSGANMVEEGVVDAVSTYLFPVVDLLTPNVNEVRALTGNSLSRGESLQQAAQTLLESGCNSVLIKGGHLPLFGARALDYWTDGARELALSSERLVNVHTHGSGCTLASAIAAAIAQNYFIEDALVIAKAYLNQGLKSSRQLGKGEGAVSQLSWPTDKADFPEVVLAQSKTGRELGLSGNLVAGERFTPCDTLRLGLYPVLDTIEWLERMLKMGVRTLQLRIKDQPSDQVEDLIIEAVALGRTYNARLFINDYWRLAIKHQAYGVHLGQEDMQIADLPAIASAGLRLGLSTHGYYELLRAQALKPSYIALGHIFPTQTKDMPSAPQGLERLARYAHLLSDTPTVAIGGIDIERAPAVWNTGVGGIAVVTAITLADDPQAVVKAINDVMEGAC